MLWHARYVSRVDNLSTTADFDRHVSVGCCLVWTVESLGVFLRWRTFKCNPTLPAERLGAEVTKQCRDYGLAKLSEDENKVALANL